MAPFFSVICPTYNVEKYLMKFYESLAQQKVVNFELIFVNDGSTDATERLILELQKRDPRVKLITKKNQGSGEARNTGLAAAKGQYVLFADPDDYFEPNALGELSLYLSTYHPQVALFGFNLLNFKDQKVIKKIHNKQLAFAFTKTKIRELFSVIVKENRYNPVWNKVFSRNFLMNAQITFPKNRTAQDAIFVYLLLNQMDSLLIIPKCYYNYMSKRPSSAQNVVHLKYKDDFQLLQQQIKTFQVWGNQGNILIQRAIITFFITLIINYQGEIPNEVKSSAEYIESKSLLAALKYSKKHSILSNIKLFLVKNKLYKFVYYLYQKP